MGKILDPNGQRKFETVKIEIKVSSTNLSLEEITRIKKDLVSSLPESLKLEVNDSLTSVKKVSTLMTLRTQEITLCAY